MKFRNIHIIINPASGVDEPILSILNKELENTEINWDVTVIHTDSDLKNVVLDLIEKTDLIAVYGGDGTVVEVAKQLIGKNTPMAIIPGGTANVLAKELSIPTDTIEAIKLLKNKEVEIRQIDTGLVNGQPFLIRINFGIMADMVSHADRQMKDSLGQLAYGITALQTLTEIEPITYKMTIDGKELIEKGVSLTVTNSGNIGITGYSFLPDISVEDGFFDVILLGNTDFMSLLRVASSTLFQTESEVLKHWKCKEITIELDAPTTFICDDIEKEARKVEIKVNPKSLHILTPISNNKP
ncbi:MAG: diacylglycerol/lipid kinase family protein [Cytophagales bacterium]